jgi:hypothetical protein
VALFSGGHALGATLSVGGSVFNPVEPDPTGGIVIDSMTMPFSVPGKYSGSLTSQVISGDPSNPYGGLTFTYSLTSNPGSVNVLTALTVNGYASSLTDVSYRLPGVGPTNIDRLTADVIGFRFMPTVFIPGFGLYGNGVITGGTTSALMVVQSNLKAYTTTTAQVIDGAVTSVTSFAPVPEPATFVLAGLGAIGALGLAARRRQN